MTAARLPYFDGDYWPGAAKDIINQICLSEDDKNLKKRKVKKTITKRALKVVGLTNLSGNASKDAMLMQKVYFFLLNAARYVLSTKFCLIFLYLNHQMMLCSLEKLFTQ